MDDELTAVVSALNDERRARKDGEVSLLAAIHSLANIMENCQRTLEKYELHNLEQTKQIQNLKEAVEKG